MKDPIMTPVAVARRLGKSERTIALYAIEGKLACMVTTTGRRLFRQSDVEKFAREQDGRGPNQAA